MRSLRWSLLLVSLILVVSCAQPAPTATPVPTVPPTATLPTATATPVPTTVPPEVSAAMSAAAAVAGLTVPADGIVASVNGTKLTMTDYAQYVGLRLMATGEAGLDWSDPANAERLVSLRREVMDQLTNMALISQEAAKAKVTLDEAEVTQFGEQVRASLTGSLEPDKWEAFKTDTGLTDATFDRIIRESLLLKALAKVAVPLDDVEQIKAAHILVDDAALAAELATRIAAGEELGELAKEYSQDPGSAANGGDLGWFPRGMMVPEFEEAAFALEPGQVSEVVKTDYGYHLIQVTEKKMRPLEPPYDEMARSQAFNEWFAVVRQNADVQIHLNLDEQTAQ